MAWAYLFLAGLFEICWAVGLKYADGFNRPWPLLFVVVALAASLALLSLAMRSLPLGTAYAVWVGIGALGSVAAGALYFGEPLSPLRVMFVALLVAALVGLKLTGDAAH